jgi:hypothetical protein
VTGGEEGRPLPGPAAQKTPHPVDRVAPWADSPTQLRRRRAASWRLPALDCGRCDPWPEPGLLGPPCSYGLSAAELHAEARRLRAAGWRAWEISATLADPRQAA